MFARGWACLHSPLLLVPKIPAAKPRISITSKLIENKRYQVQYSGHLRKTGGRGNYQLPTRHPLFPPHSTLARPPQLQRRRVTRLLLSPLFPLHTDPSLVCLLFPLLTQKHGGGGMSSQISFLFRPFTKKCRRADIFDFSPDISHFLPLTGLQHSRGEEQKSWLERPARHWGNRLGGGGDVEGLAFD